MCIWQIIGFLNLKETTITSAANILWQLQSLEQDLSLPMALPV